MIESTEELRKICQPRKEEIWFYRAVRKMSIYITRLLLSTKITANQVTSLNMLLLLIAGLLLTFGNYWYSILGASLSNLYSVFDCVDGEMARYESHKRMRSKASSLIGSSLETISHGAMTPFVFMCASFGVYNNLQDVKVFMLGFSVSLSFMLYWFSDLLFPEFNEAQYAQVSMDNPKYSRTTQLLSRIYHHKIWLGVTKNLFACATMFITILVMIALNLLYIFLIFYGATLPLLVVAFLYLRLSNLKNELSTGTDNS